MSLWKNASNKVYERVKSVTDVLVWIGGGVDADNIEQVMAKTDGMIGKKIGGSQV